LRKDALNAGADILVVGRGITASMQPMSSLTSFTIEHKFKKGKCD